jgi:hypothetical protein
MKFTSNKGDRAEAVVLRLITLVLGTYTFALVAQTVGLINLA